MKAIIIGAGQVGSNLAMSLEREGVEIVVVDEQEEVIREIMEEMDAQTILASGTNLNVLTAAGVKDAGMVVAVTDSDEKNILACILAKECGVPITVARVREQNFSTPNFSISLEKLGVDNTINPNLLVAKEIAQLAKFPNMTDWYEFADGKIKLVGFKIGDDAPITNKKLKEMPPIPSLRVAAIIRNDLPIIPSGEDRILSGDKLFVIAKKETLKKAFRLVNKGKPSDLRKIVIVGGGRVGYNIARELDQDNFTVTIIEKGLKRCNFLSENLKKTLVLNGDGKDQKLLMQEGIWNTNTFISVTNENETNLLTALLAKRHDVPKTISLITNEEFVPLASSLGIDIPINPLKLTADFIMRLTHKSKILSMATLLENKAETLEIAALATSKCAGLPLKKVKIPRGSLIGAIVRGEKVIIPGGEDVILPNDRVIVFTLPSSQKKVEALFES